MLTVVKDRSAQTEGHTTKYVTSTTENGQGHQRKGSLRNFHTLTNPKGKSQLNVMCNLMVFWNSIRTLGRNYGTSNKV